METNGIGRTDVLVESGGPAVSWAAILAGAAAAIAASVVLVMLGNGLGLSAASPWRNAGASAAALTVGAGVWLIVVQWLASGLGGYISGRLRTKWANLHGDEVFFRDTAHGFLAWAVATVVVSVIIASATLGAIGGAVHMAGNVAGGAAQGAGMGAGMGMAQRPGMHGPSDYLMDSLFRPADVTQTAAQAPAEAMPEGAAPDAATPEAATPAPTPSAAQMPGMGRRAGMGPRARGEATTIIVKGVADGDVSPEDRAYLAKLVAANTGLSEADARTRVDNTITQAKDAEVKAREAADKARKAAAAASIIMALSLVIGAFIAGVAGAIGGRQRDEY